MKNKTFWIGFVVIFVLLQVMNFLLHGVVLDPAYQKLTTVFRAQEAMMAMMPWMWISGAVLLFFFAHIFTLGREGKGAAEGARYGVLMGLFYSVPTAIDQHVVYPVPADIAVIWAIAGVFSFTICGMVFAAIYKPAG